MQVVWTNAPCRPNDRPPTSPATMPVHFPMNALTLNKFWRCTPAKTPFISGTPDPSASLLMYSLVKHFELKFLTQLMHNTSLKQNAEWSNKHILRETGISHSLQSESSLWCYNNKKIYLNCIQTQSHQSPMH